MLHDTHFDLNHFFKYGYTVTQLSPALADYMLRLIEAEKFKHVDQEEIYVTYRRIASYHPEIAKRYPEMWTENDVHVQAFDKIKWKDVYTHFWNDVLQQEYFSWFKSSFGVFSSFGMLAHKFNAGEELGWHRDLIEATYFGNILYLGDDDYTKDDGGYLRVGRVKLDDKNSPRLDTLEVLGEILPNHGTLVTVTNLDPCILHDVVKLQTDKRRYTHGCRFGFIENRVSKKESAGDGFQ